MHLLREILALLKQKRIDERDARARAPRLRGHLRALGCMAVKDIRQGLDRRIAQRRCKHQRLRQPHAVGGHELDLCIRALHHAVDEPVQEIALEALQCKIMLSQVVHRRQRIRVQPLVHGHNVLGIHCILNLHVAVVQKHVDYWVLAPAVHGPRRERDTARRIDCLPCKNPRNVWALAGLNLALGLFGPEAVVNRRRQKLARVGLGGRRSRRLGAVDEICAARGGAACGIWACALKINTRAHFNVLRDRPAREAVFEQRALQTLHHGAHTLQGLRRQLADFTRGLVERGKQPRVPAFFGVIFAAPRQDRERRHAAETQVERRRARAHVAPLAISSNNLCLALGLVAQIRAIHVAPVKVEPVKRDTRQLVHAVLLPGIQQLHKRVRLVDKPHDAVLVVELQDPAAPQARVFDTGLS